MSTEQRPLPAVEADLHAYYAAHALGAVVKTATIRHVTWRGWLFRLTGIYLYGQHQVIVHDHMSCAQAAIRYADAMMALRLLGTLSPRPESGATA